MCDFTNFHTFTKSLQAAQSVKYIIYSLGTPQTLKTVHQFTKCEQSAKISNYLEEPLSKVVKREGLHYYPLPSPNSQNLVEILRKGRFKATY